MGLARMMELLGLLRASATGTESGSKVLLGRKRYVLACNIKLLNKVVKDFGQVYIAAQGTLTNDSLFAMVHELSASLRAQLPMLRETLDSTKKPSLASGGKTKGNDTTAST